MDQLTRSDGGGGHCREVLEDPAKTRFHSGRSKDGTALNHTQGTLWLLRTEVCPKTEAEASVESCGGGGIDYGRGPMARITQAQLVIPTNCPNVLQSVKIKDKFEMFGLWDNTHTQKKPYKQKT